MYSYEIGNQYQCIESLISLFIAGDRDEAINLLNCWGKEFGYQEAINDILEPAITKFGHDWGQTEQVSLGQGYVLGKVAEDIFETASKEYYYQSIPESKGPVIMGNIEDDNHALGRKLVITFLKIKGWKVIDLGNDITAKEFVDTAIENNAPIIGISAMILRTALNIKSVRQLIDRRNLADKIKLAVGGAVFCQRPELVKEIGGDGTAVNAILVPDLFDNLLEKSKLSRRCLK